MEFEWPNDSRTPNKRDEIVPPHSPTAPSGPHGLRENKPPLWQSGDVWRPKNMPRAQLTARFP